MDADRFDRLAITFGHRLPRRSVVRLLAALGLTGLGVRDVAAVCLANGLRCGGGRGTCCSGRCVRKGSTRKKFCRAAPDQGICTTDSDYCETLETSCGDGSGTPCLCFMTLRGESFCASFNSDVTCVSCKTNAECEQLIVGGQRVGKKGDRCLQCSICTLSGGRACVHQCPNPATP
jgi:hypothetical protein